MDNENGIGKTFMERTKHRYLGPSDQSLGVPLPPFEPEAEPDAGVVRLRKPEVFDAGAIDLRDAIEKRRSVRDYAQKPLSRDELSYLLWCTQGVREVLPGCCTLRTVPSAGARHAFETYLLVNRVESILPGLYRYRAFTHDLVVRAEDTRLAGKAVSCCYGQRFVAQSAVTMIWTAVVYRMTWRYGERGYRYIHLDAGHVCQNLYLASLSVGCGACAIAAFDDDALSDLLGIDGTDQIPVYLCTVGKIPRTRE
jgi:SagB-type dehydrogenase family enzyme